MDQISFEGITVDFDREATRQLSRSLWGCPCDDCTYINIARCWFSNPQQVQYLANFGVNPLYPPLAWSGTRLPQDPKSHTRSDSCWLIRGRLIGASTTPVLRLDRWNWMWLSSQPYSGSAFGSQVDDAINDYPDIVFAYASNTFPWLPDLLTTTRIEQFTDRCPQCGCNSRVTGYLTRKSQIPNWFNMPELQRIFLLRESRVCLEFCSRCGKLTYRIVPRKPPFRRKNQIYKAWLALHRANFGPF